MKSTDPRLCFEAGTKVSGEKGETADGKLYARASAQNGYLDVNFADLYFFKDAKTARAQADEIQAGLRQYERSHPEARKARTELHVDLFTDYELRGNVLIEYSATGVAPDDRSLTNACLAKAGDRQELTPG